MLKSLIISFVPLEVCNIVSGDDKVLSLFFDSEDEVKSIIFLITAGNFDRVIINGEKEGGYFVQVIKNTLQRVIDGLFNEGICQSYTLLGGGVSYLLQPKIDSFDCEMIDGYLDSVLFSLGFSTSVSAEDAASV